MGWWQFSLNCAAHEVDAVEAALLEQGALSISIGDAGDEPIYEPPPGSAPLWSASNLTATFDDARDADAIYRQLRHSLPEHLLPALSHTRLEERDWEQAYREHFQPIECAPGLWIVPSWCEIPDPEATVVRLDPGLAFGTGSHATTFLCLAWLARAELAQCAVIDYGCGSGILAIAACKLGARDARAVDIDPQALLATRTNATINGLEPERLRVCTPAAMETEPADLLLANILAGPLLELAPRFAGLVCRGGRILLSGILESQLDEIQSAYRPYFELDAASTREDWVCISGNRI